MQQGTVPHWLGLFLRARVGQIVEVDLLAIAIDPGGDEAEPVEMRACRLVTLAQREPHYLLVERDGDFTPTSGGGGRIFQGPVVRLPVRIDTRLVGRSMAAAVAVHPIRGTEEETFAARPIR